MRTLRSHGRGSWLRESLGRPHPEGRSALTRMVYVLVAGISMAQCSDMKIGSHPLHEHGARDSTCTPILCVLVGRLERRLGILLPEIREDSTRLARLCNCLGCRQRFCVFLQGSCLPNVEEGLLAQVSAEVPTGRRNPRTPSLLKPPVKNSRSPIASRRSIERSAKRERR